MLGYAFCGSFCTHAHALRELRNLLKEGHEIQPIMSDAVWSTNTRFGKAKELQNEVELLFRDYFQPIVATVLHALTVFLHRLHICHQSYLLLTFSNK